MHPHHGGFHHRAVSATLSLPSAFSSPCQGHQIQAVLHQLLAKITRHSSTHAQ